MMGEIDVPASTLTCAGCHGMRGEGITEGGVTAGNMTWNFLTKPYGHSDDGGRKHPPFTETSVARLMTAGFDPAGNIASCQRLPPIGSRLAAPPPLTTQSLGPRCRGVRLRRGNCGCAGEERTAPAYSEGDSQRSWRPFPSP